jgi:hypothetical protein
LRGALATKKSRLAAHQNLDCFASLAMTAPIYVFKHKMTITQSSV